MLENFFSSTGVLLENIVASPAPYLRTAERRRDFGFGITEDCKSMFYDDERLVLAANGLRFSLFHKDGSPQHTERWVRRTEVGVVRM